MSLKILIFILVVAQISNGYRIQKSSGTRGIKEELDNIIVKLKTTIINGLREMENVYIPIYNQIDPAIKQQFNDAKPRIVTIYEDYKQKLKDLREDAKEMGYEILDCVKVEGTVLLEAFKALNNGTAQCKGDAANKIKELFDKGRIVMEEIVTLITEITTELSECTDLVCYIELVDSASEDFQNQGEIIQEYIELVAVELPIIQVNLDSCSGEEINKLVGVIFEVLVHGVECINRVKLPNFP